MVDPKSSSDRFHPGMPAIPGLSSQPAAADRLPPGPRVLILICGVLLLSALVGLWFHAARNRSRAQAGSQADPQDVLQDAAATEPLSSTPQAESARTGPGQIARLDELSKPWSSVAFTFIRPDTHEEVPAIVVRLPGSAAGSGSYWAFSLVEPYGKCQLVYLTDPKTLASQFGFVARHPMVADPCDGAVFDPLGMGVRPDGKWIRGEIVQGGALRPPLSIELSVHDADLYADRIE